MCSLINTAKLLSAHDSLSELTDRFADFVVDKIHKFRRNLDLGSNLDGSPLIDHIDVANRSENNSCATIDDNVVVDMPAGVKGVDYVESEVTELHYLKPVSLEKIDRIL